MGRGIAAFFAGGLTFLAYARIRTHVRGGALWGIATITVLLWIAAVSNLSHGTLYFEYRTLLGNRALVKGHDFIGVALNSLTSHSFALLVFPSTILFLALLEGYGGRLFRRLAFLGDISYSSYLLHFPLQMCFLFFTLLLGIDREIFSSPWMLLTFFATLILLAAVSYRWFELPVQHYLRTRFSKRAG